MYKLISAALLSSALLAVPATINPFEAPALAQQKKGPQVKGFVFDYGKCMKRCQAQGRSQQACAQKACNR
jgi:hypothetical protein